MTKTTIQIKPEIFFINFNEIQGRLDPYFYRPEFRELEEKLENSKYNLKRIEDISDLITDGIHKTPEYAFDGLPFIQVNNIQEGKINFVGCSKFVSNSWKKEVLSRYSPQKEDVLITKDGTIGKAALIEKIPFDFSIFVSVAAIRPKQKIVLGKFLEIVINLDITQRVIKRKIRGAALVHFLLEDISNLKIPVPPKEIQKQIIDLMDNAYNLKKQNEEKAKELIGGIDDFVLEKLGIKIPKIEEKMCFVINSKEVENNRIDAEFHQEKYKLIEKILKNEKNLNKIARIERGIFISIEKYNSGNKKYIRIGDLKYNNFLDNKKVLSVDFEGRSGKVFKGEILMTVIGATIGKNVLVQKENDGNYFSSNLVKIIAKDKNINSEFLAIFLQSSLGQEQIFRNSTMTAQPKINEKELSNLKIPVPPLEIQEEIAEEVKSRLKKAKELKKSASENLRTAKEKVEKILLD